MIKALPCISSIEFEGDKSDIPLLLSVQMQVKNDISLKLLLSHDCFEPITAQDFPAIFDFWRENSIFCGKISLETVPNQDFGGKSGKISLETVTFGAKTSILAGTQARMSEKNNKMQEISLYHRIKSLPDSLLSGYHFYYHLGCFWKSYTPCATHSGYNFSRNIPRDNKNDTHLEVVR